MKDILQAKEQHQKDTGHINKGAAKAQVAKQQEATDV